MKEILQELWYAPKEEVENMISMSINYSLGYLFLIALGCIFCVWIIHYHEKKKSKKDIDYRSR